jgi:hypothetical protein
MLALTFDPFHLEWWLLAPRYLYLLTMINQKIIYFGEIQFLRHNVKILVDLESTHQGLSYGVMHDMVPYGIFDSWGK